MGRCSVKVFHRERAITIGCTATGFPPFRGSKPVRELGVKHLIEIVGSPINNIHRELFAIFDCIMAHAEYAPSYFQSEIRSGYLSDQDIMLGLQNKCLNEHYLYNESINNRMLIVGEKLVATQTQLID